MRLSQISQGSRLSVPIIYAFILTSTLLLCLHQTGNHNPFDCKNQCCCIEDVLPLLKILVAAKYSKTLVVFQEGRSFRVVTSKEGPQKSVVTKMAVASVKAGRRLLGLLRSACTSSTPLGIQARAEGEDGLRVMPRTFQPGSFEKKMLRIHPRFVSLVRGWRGVCTC